MNFDTFLQHHHQDHILTVLDTLSSDKKVKLIEQIIKITPDGYKGPTKELILENPSFLREVANAGSKHQIKIGVNTLAQKKVGCLIFSGGEGSRLNKDLPKGLFEIGGKSLFAYIFRWIAAYNKAFNLTTPVIILVSSQNKKTIQSYFKKHNFFNTPSSKVLFLEQTNYPYFDKGGKWILLDHSIAMSANGNGGFLEVLQTKKAKKFLKDNQLQYLHFIPIDNPLDDPLDVNLLGFVKKHDLDAAIKTFKKEGKKEKFGAIYQKGEKHLIVDYMHLSKKDSHDFQYANGGHYCMRVSSLRSLEKKRVKLPYHFVQKSVKKLPALKGEKFAFDTFYHFKKVLSLCYEKAAFFAPLKEEENILSIEHLLSLQQTKIYEAIYKKRVPKKYKLTDDDFVSYLKTIFF